MKADIGATILGNEGQVHGTKNESSIDVGKLREIFVFLNSLMNENT